MKVHFSYSDGNSHSIIHVLSHRIVGLGACRCHQESKWRARAVSNDIKSLNHLEIELIFSRIQLVNFSIIRFVTQGITIDHILYLFQQTWQRSRVGFPWKSINFKGQTLYLRAGLLGSVLFLSQSILRVKMSTSMTDKLLDDMNSIPLADDDPQGRELVPMSLTQFS